MFFRFTALSMAALLAACSQAAPGWDRLISDKISEQYPAYKVLATEAGQLRVQRPGQVDKTVDVADIANFASAARGTATTRWTRCCWGCAGHNSRFLAG